MKKILIVDDDPDILDALKLTLEDAGYEVVTSEDGERAENLPGRNGKLPDLILLDVLLSGRDGREICRKLKSQEDTKNIPIIMISAHPSIVKSYKDIHAEAFVDKPFDIDRLLKIVEKYIK